MKNLNMLMLGVLLVNSSLFHPSQKRVEASIIQYTNQTFLTEKDSIWSLDIVLDSNLNWKKTKYNQFQQKLKETLLSYQNSVIT